MTSIPEHPPEFSSDNCAPADMVTSDNSAARGEVLLLFVNHDLDEILDQHALAQELGRSGRTIRRMVEKNELPKPIKMMGKSRWLVGAIYQHLINQHEQAAHESAQFRQKVRECRP